jgi:hypothetical protein
LGAVQAEKKRLRDMNRLEDQEDQGWTVEPSLR